MWHRLTLLFVLVAIPAYGQVSARFSTHTTCTLQVDVAFATGGKAISGARVQLLQGLSNAAGVEVEMTNSTGSVDFNVFPGDYRVEVSWEGIESTHCDFIHIDDGHVFVSMFVAVRKSGEANSAATSGAVGNSVSVAELNVPKEASEELARGDAEMKHKHWKKAAEHFQKATSIYPKYASAYYNLSAAYFQLKKADEQRDALLKALKINENFVPALVSLAHVDVAEHKAEQARPLLDKAISADPTNVEALALRVRVDFMQGQYQQAVDDAQRVHELPHKGYASVHYTAAAALQQLNRIPEMIAQLELLLQEDPSNPRADYIRKTIAELKGQSH